MWSKKYRRKVPASLSAIALAVGARWESGFPVTPRGGEPGVEILAERAGDHPNHLARIAVGGCLAYRFHCLSHSFTTRSCPSPELPTRGGPGKESLSPQRSMAVSIGTTEDDTELGARRCRIVVSINQLCRSVPDAELVSSAAGAS